MWLSSRTRYGLRAMYELAESYGQGPIALTSISEKQDISLSYLEQIFALLKRNKLIISVRGAHGGYRLYTDPSEIIVGEIIRALEGSLAPTDCAEVDGHSCSFASLCFTRPLWAKINDSINSVVDHMTLQDMIDEYKEQLSAIRR